MANLSIGHYKMHLSFILLIFMALLSDTAGACMIIDSAGSYGLSGDSTGAPYEVQSETGVGRACVVIASSNVEFDCKGYYIKNIGVADAAAIVINGSDTNEYTDISIVNCPSLNGYEQGLLIYHAQRVSAEEILCEYNSRYGVHTNFLREGSFNSITATDNPDGFFIQNTRTSNLTYSVATRNANGFLFGQSIGNRLERNIASRNTNDGFSLIKSSEENILTLNRADGNSRGFLIEDSASNKLISNIAYDNGYDLEVNNFFGSSIFQINITKMSFRNPSGSLANSTNLSLVDRVEIGRSFWINWTSNKSSLPEGRASVLQKFVEIEGSGGSQSIDSVLWHWKQDELFIGLDESRFELWRYGIAWAMQNNTPDTSDNSIGLNDFDPESDYGILQENITECTYANTSNAVYTLGADVEGNKSDGACFTINAMNVTIDCNGHAISGNSEDAKYGMNISNLEQTTIRNCDISGYYDGIISISANNSVFSNNTLHNNTNNMRLSGVRNVTITNNRLYNGSYGFLLILSSSDNRLINNSANNHSDTGFFISTGTLNNTIENPVAEGNYHGFFIQSSNENNITRARINGSTGYGIYIHNSNSTNIESPHLYNNAMDFRIWTSSGDSRDIEISNALFDNPQGSLQNYTNISISDSVPSAQGFTVNWSSRQFPDNSRRSFDNKNINISPIGNPSLDSVTWHWLDSELAGYNESRLELWRYSSGSWSRLNNTPSTSTNSFTILDLEPASDYGLYQANMTECFYASISNYTYRLITDLRGNKGDGACITINATNVTIDGNGYSVTGNRTGTTYGLYALSRSGLVVGNLTVSNYSTGVYIRNSYRPIVRNVNSTYPRGGGSVFDMQYSNFMVFDNNSASDASGSSVLLWAYGADHAIISNNYFGETSGSLIYMFEPENSSIYGNMFVNSLSSNGVDINSMDETVIYNNTFIGVQRAFTISGGMDSSIYGNRIQDGTGGIRMIHHAILYTLDNITFRDNNLTGLNGTGILIDSVGADSTNCQITGNIVNTSGTAMSITAVRANSIYNNLFNGSVPAYADNNNNYWNTSQQTGPNIIGGQDIGGNYYSDYSGVDITGDGIGETPYNISGNPEATDFLPLKNGAYYHSCFNATAEHATYRLGSDIVGNLSDGNCIRISASNVTIDCEGHSLSADTANTNGIFSDEQLTTVRNCTIIDYNNGIYFSGGRFGNIENTTVEGASKGGFFVELYDATNMSNIICRSCDSGLLSYSSGYNNFTGVAITNSTTGMHFDNSRYNRIYNSSVKDGNNLGSVGILVRNGRENFFTNVSSEHGTYAVRIFYGSDRTYFSDCRFGNSSSSASSACAYVDSSTRSVFNNTVISNCSNGFYIEESGYDQILNSNITNSSQGIYLLQSNYSKISANDISGMNRMGIVLNETEQNNITANQIHDNQEIGTMVYLSTEILVENNRFYGNWQTGFVFAESNHSNATGNNATGNLYSGIGLSNSHENSISRNRLLHNQDTGIYIEGSSSGNNATGNYLNNNTNSGLIIAVADWNRIENNTAQNSTYGYYVRDSEFNSLEGNLAKYNERGFYIEGENCTLENNTASQNSWSGFHISRSNNTITNNTAYDNSQFGLILETPEKNPVDIITLYDNGLDFMVQNFEIGASALNLTNATFRNSTSGALVMLEVHDYLSPISAYSIDMSTEPGSLPSDQISFRDKFIDISTQLGSISIDKVVWKWLDSELPGYNESEFGLWNYAEGSWSLINDTPNTSSNTLSIFNHDPNSIYGILEGGENCQVIDSSGEYMMGNDYTEAPNSASPLFGHACVKITASDVIFDCNGYNITNELAGETAYGILVIGTLNNVTVRNCPSVSGYDYGVYVRGVNDSILSNLTSHDNNYDGLTLTQESGNNTISDMVLFGNDNGIVIESGSENNLTNNSAYMNFQHNFRFYAQSSGNYLERNKASTSDYCYLFESGGNNTLIGNRASNCTQYGYSFEWSSDQNILLDNIAETSNAGFYLLESSRTNLTGNTANDNSQYGFYLESDSVSNNFTMNSARNNSDGGFYISGSQDLRMIGNNASECVIGFYLDEVGQSTITGNNAHDNSDYGFYLSGPQTTSNILLDNSAYDNDHSGFIIESGANSIDLMGGEIHGNSQNGIYLRRTNGINITGAHLYNNGRNMYLSTDASSMNVNFTDLIIDAPSGIRRDYSTISILDSLEPNSAYAISWTSNPGNLPENRSSFANKFVNITALSGTVSIQSISWTWENSELPGYNESNFELWRYSSGSWTLQNDTPNINSNSISLQDMVPASDYGLLMNGIVNASDSGMIELFGVNITNETRIARWNPVPQPGNNTLEGGNLSDVGLDVPSLTDKWAAFYGNVTGELVLTTHGSADAQRLYSWDFDPATSTGAICVSTNSTLASLAVKGARGTDIDDAWSFASSDADSGNNTFNNTDCIMGIGGSFISNASYVDTGAPGGFITCALMANDTITAQKADMLFCSNVTEGTNYNGTAVDFELMVPTVYGTGTETYYFYVNLG